MCTNSIGSSMVRMWSCRSVLILSIMAARVVDFPDPVGPVTSTKPRGLSHILLTTAGSPSWLKRLDLERNQTEDGRGCAPLVKYVSAEASQTFQSEREIQLQIFFKTMLLRIGHD